MKIGWILLIILAFTLTIVSCSPKFTYPSFSGFFITRNYTEGNDTAVIQYSNNHDIIRLKIVSATNEEDASQLINNALVMMKSVYDATFSAYPGMLSNEIICDLKFIPTLIKTTYEDKNVSYYIAYLSNRLKYGACADDLVQYRGVIAWSYCANKRELWQLEYISPIGEFSNSTIGYVLQHICS